MLQYIQNIGNIQRFAKQALVLEKVKKNDIRIEYNDSKNDCKVETATLKVDPCPHLWQIYMIQMEFSQAAMVC